MPQLRRRGQGPCSRQSPWGGPRGARRPLVKPRNTTRSSRHWAQPPRLPRPAKAPKPASTPAAAQKPHSPPSISRVRSSATFVRLSAPETLHETGRAALERVGPQRGHCSYGASIAAQGHNGHFFPLPEPVFQGEATRVMSLREGSKKMSQSTSKPRQSRGRPLAATHC